MHFRQHFFVLALLLSVAVQSLMAQQRRPIDSQHPLWLVHIDVWNKADPQKIINLIPEDIRPYVCMNLSLSCQYDKEKNIYKMPQNAVRTYKSWATVCQANGLWFTCQPASGGHTHIQDDDIETFEYFFRHYPNFLGWNYAEQFWGFDEPGDKSSSTQSTRWALFARLVEMSHRYGGFLTVSFCGNIWSHPLNPIGELKRNKELLAACRDYPEAILWLYKYTTSSCFYNNESVTFGPFISGLAKNYGVRYDNCGWNGTLDALLGKNHGKKYPIAAGIGTVMEQTAVNGGAVWDGPELIWTEDFQNLDNSEVNGYKRRNWGTFPGFRGAWIDMFRKIIDGSLYVPTREEVVNKTKIVVINNVTSGSDEQKYATWGTLYDGLYKQSDPFNRGNGQWMDNFCYFKRTGRYGTIPMVTALYDDVAKSIPVQVKKSAYSSRWSTEARKVADFDAQYPEVSKGDLYVNRYRNQLVTYTPYSYLNAKTTATAEIPLAYNTCETLDLTLGKLGSALVREYADHIDFYLNNFRTDTTTLVKETIIIKGASAEPTYTLTPRLLGKGNATAEWNAEEGTYTLNVNHMGAVDVSISCAGNATERATDFLASEALPIPQQPEAYHGEIIIEAEDMDYKDIKSCVTDPYGWYPSVRGHAGNGFMDMGTNTTGALRHQLNLAETGNYTISLRYTCATKSGKMRVTVNGRSTILATDQTATNEWRKVSFETALKAGTNNLIVTNASGQPAYIDQIIYTPADIEPEKFLVTVRPSEHGAVEADLSEAAEGETVTLNITAEEGYGLKELRVVNGVYYTLAQTISLETLDDNGAVLTFVMPDDNVTLQPVFYDASSVYKLNFDDVASGTVPSGWRCVQENNEVHQAPTTYTSGARTLTGFGGYQGKGLYWREQCAEYGRLEDSPLRLETGRYKLKYAMAAWKGRPNFKVQVLNATTGSAIAASETFTSTPNANGNQSANLASAVEHELVFDIDVADNYVISFTNESKSSVLDEYLLLECNLLSIPAETDGISVADAASGESFVIYDLGGVRRTSPRRGINILRTADGKTRKMLIQ